MYETQVISISMLKPLKNNPRKITKEQFDKLRKSMLENDDFLMLRPILVNVEPDGTHRIYAGNQRYRAAKSLKLKELPCIIDHGLSEPEIKRRTILDNKTYGEFDFDILANEYDTNMLFECGFTPFELEGVIENIDTSTQMPDNVKKEKICPHCGEVI